MWAARGTFIECSYTVGQLCKVMSRPNKAAWNAAMHLIGYIYQTRHRGLWYSSDSNAIPIAMSDASNRSDPRDSKRSFGYVVCWMGGPILFTSRKLNHCSAATAANEYMALSMTAKHVVWLRQLFMEIGLEDTVKEPTIIYADNQSANKWANEEVITQGNMYILESYHFVKDMGSSGEGVLQVVHVPTKHNIADLFTKGVPPDTHKYLTGYLSGEEPLLTLLKNIKDMGGQSNGQFPATRNIPYPEPGDFEYAERVRGALPRLARTQERAVTDPSS